MDEFRRTPVNRLDQPGAQPSRPAQSPPALPQLSELPPLPMPEPTKTLVSRPKKKRTILWWVIGFAGALVLVAGAVVTWYNVQLTPANKNDATKKVVKVAAGSLPSSIADQLKKEGLIRDATAFLWYARSVRAQNSLQAGVYRLSPSESTPQIIEHLSKGSVDTFRVTFLPGATVSDNKKMLERAGYAKSEIDAAFAKTYAMPLFDGKPASADLEGYIYGDTYEFTTDATVETILARVFEEFSQVVKENDLVNKFKAHNLSLYEGVTLASIVQREASPKGDDMPQIAQVFYRRLSLGMPLGSDVTYQYIADKTGQQRDPNLDSPYNTRKYPGLPPGPIATPGKKALLAVANPASGDYLFFLSGDDNVTYFAKTLDEHNANIRQHCVEKCQII